jgi:hypothetical protein
MNNWNNRELFSRCFKIIIARYFTICKKYATIKQVKEILKID